MYSKKTIGIALAIVVVGVISGYGLSRSVGAKSTSTETTQRIGDTTGKTSVGSSDTKTYTDSAEGDLQAGGLDGEGTHKLIRPGGDSQTVYLTSSVLDLDQFVGKKVRVWGETFAGDKAGWFMDVGKVETL